MWTINAPAPEFCVRTAHGLLGPGDLLGSWAVLLHCSRPCVPGCSVCMVRLGQVTTQLGTRDLRLVMALDAPDKQLDSQIHRPVDAAPGSFVVGAWQAPASMSGPGTTLLAVIDPGGFVRALAEVPNVAPLSMAFVLDCVDRALGHSPGKLPAPAAPASAETYGCVGWFDYGADSTQQ